MQVKVSPGKCNQCLCGMIASAFMVAGMIFGLASCGGGDSPAATYSVGGTVSGLLANATIVLQNNGADDLTVTNNGAFTFATRSGDSVAYDVTFTLTPPMSQPCTSTYGAGTISGADVTSVNVFCGPPSVDAFSTNATGLATPRQSHTATLLANGKVLVAGGWDGANALTSAELYDPASQTWSSAGDMTIARYNHTATLLPNGKVLVAGGWNDLNGTIVLASAELYDPASQTWSSAGNLAIARQSHTATLLPNGKVLVAGGWSASVLGSSELYDPASNTWSPGTRMANVRYGHTATLMPGGKVLVAGGYSGTIYMASAELYDPVSNTWSPAANLSTARSTHTATLLPDGTVLVAGGINNAGGNVVQIGNAELYDPANDTWSPAGILATARNRHTATLLPTGQVLVTGGFAGGSTDLSSCELYDPVTNTWLTSAASLAATSVWHTATLLTDGTLLVAGGGDSSRIAMLALAQRYW